MRLSRHGVALALSVIPFTAAAQGGGFVGPDGREPPVKVVEAANLAEDAPVRLVGYIMKSLGDDLYEFSDETGTITVEIDDDEWNGV